MTQDFSDLTVKIQCRAQILRHLGGSNDNPLLLHWLDIRRRYSLSYSQYEELSEWLIQECRRAYRVRKKSHTSTSK